MARILFISALPLAAPGFCVAETAACMWACATLSATACIAIAVSASIALFGGLSFVNAMSGLDAIRD